MLSLNDAEAAGQFDPTMFLPPELAAEPDGAVVEARALVTGKDLYRGVGLNAVRVSSETGAPAVSGLAVNTGTESATVVRIVALLYDESSESIWAEAGYVETNMSPGQSAASSPGDAQTVLIFTGAKSLVAGRDTGQAVALALDPHGNLVRDGTGVDFTIADWRRAAAPLRNGLAGILFQPGTKAGSFAAGATVGAVQSARALFRVTPDLCSLQAALVRVTEPLVPETSSSFGTPPLRDRFGNPVEDGVALGFTLDHDDGSTSLMTGLAHGGMADARFLARDVATGGTLSAALAANNSREIDAPLAPLRPATDTQIVAWAVPELDAMAVRVGPMTTSAGHLLTDGAPVSVELEAAEGIRDRRSGRVQDGHFEALLPLSPASAPVKVVIETPLGREVRSIALSGAPTPVRGAE